MKNIKYLLLLFIAILITGCGAKDGAEKLDRALKNMDNVNSSKIESETNVAIEGYSIIMMTEEVTAENGESYNKTTTKMLGQESYSESYVMVDDTDIIVYSGTNGKDWTYTVYKDAGLDQNLTSSGLGDYARNYKSVKEVSSDIKGHTKLEVTIDKDEMVKNLSSDSEEANFKLSKDLVMEVYIKDDYITKIKFNFEDELQVAEDGTKTKYSFEFNISEHNNIDKINIPREIIDNAKEANE